MNTKKERGKIDWMITLVPLAIVIALCVLFFFAPEQSNTVLSQIRFFFGDTFGTYYLVIGLGIFILSLYIAGSKYGNIVLGEQNEKPKYSFFAWGSMMFTCGLAVPLELYSVGILFGTGCCLRLYAPCEKKKPSEVFRGLPSDSWKVYRWLGRSHY